MQRYLYQSEVKENACQKLISANQLIQSFPRRKKKQIKLYSCKETKRKLFC